MTIVNAKMFSALQKRFSESSLDNFDKFVDNIPK